MMESILAQVSSILNPGKNFKVKNPAQGNDGSLVMACLQVIPADCSRLKGLDLLQQSLVHHWLTYLQLHLAHCTSLQEFLGKLQYVNKELSNRDYLCGFSLTVADLLFFLLLQPFVTTWTYHQKERLCNISRWYNCVQSCGYFDNAKKQPIKFSRSLLYLDDTINIV
ncbi:uncharacterized protein LOC108681795 [Hyalella azteca]|uniref:Uncharacterized protein LOC108681795 n=1 Tax=Hyalella azteca TaxID=294128 RepID=A0A8B7PJL4_HYAAZ|nr:uncharacterized protein LOC108681795 [Hyalella azteca]